MIFLWKVCETINNFDYWFNTAIKIHGTTYVVPFFY